MLRMMTASVTVLLLASATSQAQTQSGRAAASAPNAAVLDALRALVATHEAAMNKRDADPVAATYSTTADQIFFDAPRAAKR